ncbi:unnamed protein product [Sphenostylis stenocarpa]|uniref:Uncharacterized protein n=1 Tax=Sphenostylis stenocarpa TaxID=92480 RepID=A0AA86VE70_9FABA|nr:unnamed protein product [Sphenostylis stenocarpa]
MMQTEQPQSSPSFSAHSSDSFSHIATRVVHELRSDPTRTLCQQNDNPYQTDNVDAADDFEFSFVFRHTDSSPVSADDIFYNGQIRPFYPSFHQNTVAHSSVTSLPVENSRRQRLSLKTLMLEERETINNNELEGLAEGTYCVWTPPCKKKSSSPKRWRLRDLVSRSNSSDQKDSLLLVGPAKRTRKVVPKHASAHNCGTTAKLVGFFTNASE